MRSDADNLEQRLHLQRHRRLFVDNGSPSYQTRMDRCERFLKVLLWVVTIVAAASIAQVSQSVVGHFKSGHSVSAAVEATN